MSQMGVAPGVAGGETAAGLMPWDDMASREVRGLRGAITAQMAEKTVSADVAPMMAELLARLDSFVEGEPRIDVAGPQFPSGGESPSLRATQAALGRVGPKLRAQAAAGDPQKQASLQEMCRVLDYHLAMRHEVLMRTQV